MTSRSGLLARRIALVAGLLVGPGLVATAATAQAYTPSAATVAAYEARVIYKINAQRVKYGRGKLAAATCPDRYAETWASYLARGYTSADATVSAWMASPGHRANILDGSLNRIGVAAVYAYGRWTVVADFTRS
jgi:uncharacterized protein YkwD